MKIGFARRGFSETGGAEVYLRRFADAAKEAGHLCVLFASTHWPGRAWKHQTIRLPGKSPRIFADALRNLPPHQHCDVLFSLERVWECDAYRAGDGVHAAWLKHRAKYEPLWKSVLRRFSDKHRTLLRMEKNLLKSHGARHVITNSKMVKDEIVRSFGGAPDRISVIYNGVPPYSPPPEGRARVRQELEVGEGDCVCLFVGSGWERKGLRFAIEAIEAVDSPGATLIVAGRGSTAGLPSSKRTRFVGDDANIAKLLSAADIFLLPTLYDPFSNACLEALSAGLPVLTTRFNGFAEIIESGVEGEVLAEPEDVDSIVRSIQKWSDRDRRESVKPRLQSLAAKFSIEQNLRATLETILPLAVNRGRARDLR